MNKRKFKDISVISSTISTIFLALVCEKTSAITGNSEYGWLAFFITAYLEITAIQLIYKVKSLPND